MVQTLGWKSQSDRFITTDINFYMIATAWILQIFGNTYIFQGSFYIPTSQWLFQL